MIRNFKGINTLLNFEIKVCNLKDAPRLGWGWATRAVSLLDNDSIMRPDFSQIIPHHVEIFDDVISEHEISKREADLSAIVPTQQHIQNILNFTKEAGPNEKLLIHCHGGISRSTAIAFLVMIQHDLSPGRAMCELLRIRPVAWPNELVIQHGDNILKRNGLLVKFMNTWMKSNLHRMEV